MLRSPWPLLVTLLVGCVAAGPGASAARDTLDAFHAAASKADEDRYFDLFAPDGVFLGTDGTERWTVSEFRAYAHPHFAEGKGWTYLPGERHVQLSPNGQVAWFDEALTHAKYGDLRGTGVLRAIDGRWRVEQYNLTFTVPNDRAKAVVSLIQGQDPPTVPSKLGQDP